VNIRPDKFRTFYFSDDGTKFIKEIRKRNNKGEKLSDNEKNCLLNEVKALVRLGEHINITRLYETYDTPEKFIFVFEQNLTDLLELFENSVRVSEVVSFITQIATGLMFIHGKRIIHCDMKLENTVINSSGVVKIIDFEFCRDFPPENEFYSDIVGTKAYTAPEMKAKRWNVSIDIWCLGVMISIMEKNLEYECKKLKQLASKFTREETCRRLGYVNENEYNITLILDYLRDNFRATKYQPRNFKPPNRCHHFSYKLPIDAPPLLSETDSLEFVDEVITKCR
jgi:serine/threonine protein kinase